MASMSTANRMEVPAANVSSRVSTYIPPWRGGRKLSPSWLEVATKLHPSRQTHPLSPVPCPTGSESSLRTWVTGFGGYCDDVACVCPDRGLLESQGLRVSKGFCCL